MSTRTEDIRANNQEFLNKLENGKFVDIYSLNQYLRKNRVDFNFVGQKGLSALHIALILKNYEIITYLANKSDLSVCTRLFTTSGLYQFTPLHYAIWLKDKKSLEILLKAVLSQK